MNAGRRHVLVIASQCENMLELERLHVAAEALNGALRDDDIGGCSPALPAGESLLYGGLDAEAIAANVRAAIAHAAQCGATLVLAFLGHGFIAGTDPELYFMGWQSRDGVRDSAVNVKVLLVEAADRQGVACVIGVIDTCTAAAATPKMDQLVTGTRGGRARLSLLMAAGASQSAYDLGMSSELARLLRTGLPGAGTLLSLDDVKAPVQSRLNEQELTMVAYDGVGAAERMWLAYNRQADGYHMVFGAYGTGQLQDALRGLPGRPIPGNFDELLCLRRELASHPSRSQDIIRAGRVTDSLVVAHRTVAFLRQHLAAGLSSEALRRALAVACGASGVPFPWEQQAAGPAAGPAEIEAVVRVTLDYPRAHGDCRRQLARFVVALAKAAGVDPAQNAFRDWADKIDALVPYNDALAATEALQGTRRVRLIVSYYAIAGEWPEEVNAWLLEDGADRGHEILACTADQPGAEKALAFAVDWAENQATALGTEIERIEVALPARMLVGWKPEEVPYGGALLGVNYPVVTRWSQRLEPSEDMRRANRNVRKRLAELAWNQSGDPLHWLAARQVSDPDRLRSELGRGMHAPAAGLLDRPAQDGSLVDLLLRYLPIVLWPHVASLGQQHRKRVSACWSQLPDDFIAAYRASWTGGKADLIADIRAVWDEESWLRFCATVTA
jgi:hypothetical protein